PNEAQSPAQTIAIPPSSVIQNAVLRSHFVCDIASRYGAIASATIGIAGIRYTSRLPTGIEKKTRISSVQPSGSRMRASPALRSRHQRGTAPMYASDIGNQLNSTIGR